MKWKTHHGTATTLIGMLTGAAAAQSEALDHGAAKTTGIGAHSQATEKKAGTTTFGGV